MGSPTRQERAKQYLVKKCTENCDYEPSCGDIIARETQSTPRSVEIAVDLAKSQRHISPTTAQRIKDFIKRGD